MWSFYFLAKGALFLAGYLRFDTVWNLLFLAYTWVPLPQAWGARRWVRISRQLSNGVLGCLLLWHDSWVPPLGRIFEFLIDPNTAPTPRYVLDFVARYADVWVLAVAALVLLACIYAQRWHAWTRAIPMTAMAFASIVSVNQDRTPVADSVNQFFATESARTVSFTPLPDAAPPFDIILVHVCSMSWDDLEVAGLAEDEFLGQFNILFTQFNAVTPYSGLSAYRLLRSGCGQVRHDALFGPARSECYLLDRLRQYGFKSYAAMDHDGLYAEFSTGVQRLGHIDAPASLKGVPVYQYNFDDSPIFDGYSVLERWWRARGADQSAHTVLYYNTITLHEGSEWRGQAGWSDRDRVARYRMSAERFFATLQRFFALISASGRNVVVILVPEHGTALRGSAIQAAGLREIPLPQITRVPVAVKFFGREWNGSGNEQTVVNEPVSYHALAWLLAEIVRQPPFYPAPRAIDLSGLPRTRFVAEDGNYRVTEYDGSYYVLENEKKWYRIPDRALLRGPRIKGPAP